MLVNIVYNSLFIYFNCLIFINKFLRIRIHSIFVTSQNRDILKINNFMCIDNRIQEKFIYRILFL